MRFSNQLWPFVACFFILCPATFAFQSLYTSNDVGFQILENSNFSSFMHGKQKVLWVEFFNSWCGHCVRFAPTWKKMAKEVADWHQVIDLAVVDCAEDRNTEICRDYEVFLYPSLRFFWLNHTPLRDFSKPVKVSDDIGAESKSTRKPEEIGILYDGGLDATEPLRKGIIDFLIKSWSKGAPREWPDLMPFSATSKEQFTRQLPLSKNLPIVIIVEKSDSYVGREVRRPNK